MISLLHFLARTTGNVEREVTDNLIAEVTRESPFMDDDNFDQVNEKYPTLTSKP